MFNGTSYCKLVASKRIFKRTIAKNIKWVAGGTSKCIFSYNYNILNILMVVGKHCLPHLYLSTSTFTKLNITN